MRRRRIRNGRSGSAKAPQVPQEAEEGYSGMLRSIRRSNDRIADPELSRKMDRLEEIAGKILKLVEEDPAKKNQAATFLNYYLPTTEKLLDSYADFEEAGVSGENLTQAKEKIRRTMDSIMAGFERQLDALYHADAMDVDSDIRVMETMLRRTAAAWRRTSGWAVRRWPRRRICKGGDMFCLRRPAAPVPRQERLFTRDRHPCRSLVLYGAGFPSKKSVEDSVCAFSGP